MNRIIELISRWTTEINTHNQLGHTDINRHSEDVAMEMLNALYGLNAQNLNQNLNQNHLNYPAVDLADPDLGVAWQVTSKLDAEKRAETETLFKNHQLENQFPNGYRFIWLSNQPGKKAVRNKNRPDITPRFKGDQFILSLGDWVQRLNWLYTHDRACFDAALAILEREFRDKTVMDPKRSAEPQDTAITIPIPSSGKKSIRQKTLTGFLLAIFLLIGLWLSYPFFTPQKTIIQKGRVRELNSNKRGLEGVEIRFQSAPTVNSDKLGCFTLKFRNKKPGAPIFAEIIHKPGYELVNEKALDILAISDTDDLGTDIILAVDGTVDKAKMAYYRISEVALNDGFRRETGVLKKDMELSMVTPEQYRERYRELEKVLEAQRNELDRLAGLFARVNYDDVEPLYREALTLFQGGDIHGAIQILEEAKPLNDTALLLNKKKELNELSEIIKQKNAEIDLALRKKFKVLILQAELYSLTFESDKAEQIYDRLLEINDKDLDILTAAANNYRINQRFEKATAVYEKIISRPEAEAWRIANAYANLGNIHIVAGKLEKALNGFTKAHDLYARLMKENPGSSFYKNILAVLYSKLGETHAALGELSAALGFYREDLRLAKKLHEAFPNHVEYKNNLAVSYSQMGKTHAALGELATALGFYREFKRLMKELHEAFHTNVEFKNNLAVSYLLQGGLFEKQNNPSKAREYYLQAKELYRQLVKDAPKIVKYQEELNIVENRLKKFSEPHQ